MCLTNGGYISLPLCIFVLDKKGEKSSDFQTAMKTK